MIRNYFITAWRSLRKRRTTSLINLLGLTIGFACAVLIYLFVSHHLGFDDFHTDADRIYRLNTDEETDYIEYEGSVPPGMANEIRNEFTFSEAVARYADWQEDVLAVERDGATQKYRETLAFVEPEFLEIFNFPVRGGTPDALEAPNLAFITEEVAMRLFGRRDAIGETFVLGNTETIRVAGILDPLPEKSLFDREILVSFPTLKVYSEWVTSDSFRGITSMLQTFVRVRPGTDPAAVEAQLAALPGKYRPDSKNIHHYRLQPLLDIHLGGLYPGGIQERILWIVSLIGFLVLLLACINFINITTAQSLNRSREVGVRKVLGCGRHQLLRQFLSEVFLLSLFALVAGLLTAWLALPYFNDITGLSLGFESLVNPGSILFMLGILVLVTLLAGFYPGVVLGRIPPVLALKRKLTQRDSGGLRTRQVLVTLQFTISIGLIIATLVVGRQLRYAVESDLGYDTSVLMLPIPSDLEPRQLESLKARLSNHSAISQVSSCFASPGAPNNIWGTSVRYNSRPEVEEFAIDVKVADRDYLGTFGLDLVAGRNFFEKRDTVDEVLVNRTFARMVGAESPEAVLGKEIAVGGKYVRGRIVGVVEDFHDSDFTSRINPVFIAPEPGNYGEFAVKLQAGRLREGIAHLEKTWTGAFPDLLFEYEFVDERVAQQYATETQFLTLGKLFSLLAIGIGCLGIYGLVSFFVAQKTKEIGIRKVLGGSVTDILALFTREFIGLVVVAGAIAIPLTAFLMESWLQNYQYRTPLEWWVFALATAAVLLITLAIIVLKGSKAAWSNPVKSLRTE
ncbi:ABC transporter permease [Robiginitalea sp. SC105]|uniref:ABC transporter permease n=1 Tax=Robiginitalea sp. SC105 TaxID=2762332 RepID=UPI00163A3AD6|nr:ABC transporter permease [Robiginitalea sp. SC105]MBC2839395.1 ABC transporter permease [Robiginitalea sp. SC105]